MRPYLTEPVGRIRGVRVLAVYDAVPETTLFRWEILRNIVCFFPAGVVKV